MTIELSAGAGVPDLPSGFRVRRPEQSLLTYYVLTSFLLGPFFLFMLIPYYFRYRTLRYEFDAEGVTMRWGVLFRKEVSLTYARIQDIHLVSNVVERWLGLARIQIQTASGSAGAEMTIEGLKDFEAIRNDLYVRMRGVREGHRVGTGRSADVAIALAEDGSRAALGDPKDALAFGTASAELVAAMRETAAELRRLRENLGGVEVAAGGGDDV